MDEWLGTVQYGVDSDLIKWKSCWYLVCKLIPYESVSTLVFWDQQRSVGDLSLHLKFVLKVTRRPLKNAYFDQYLLITSEP